MRLFNRIGAGLAGLLMLGTTVALSSPAQADAGFVPISKPSVSSSTEMPTPPKRTSADRPLAGFHDVKGQPAVDKKLVSSAQHQASVTAAGVCDAYPGGVCRTYAGVRKTLSSPAVDNGCSFYATVHSQFVSTADVHSITECSVHFNNNIVEIGWRKTSSGSLTLFTYAWKNVGGVAIPLCYNGCGYTQYSGATCTAGQSLTGVVGQSKMFYIQHFDGVWWIAYDGGYCGYWPDSVFGTQTPTFDRTDFIQVFDELAGRQYNGTGINGDVCSDMGAAKLPNVTGAQEVTKVHVVGGTTANDTWTTFVQANGASSVNTSHYNIASFSNSADSNNSARNFKVGGPGAC